MTMEKVKIEQPAVPTKRTNAYRWTIACKFYQASVLFFSYAIFIPIISFFFFVDRRIVVVIDIVVNLIGNCRWMVFSWWHTVIHMYVYQNRDSIQAPAQGHCKSWMASTKFQYERWLHIMFSFLLLSVSLLLLLFYWTVSSFSHQLKKFPINIGSEFFC